MAPSKPFSLAIVGGGIGGLCLAVALVHSDVPIHVYEAAPAFSEIGAGVGLGPNALRAMALLDPLILKGYKQCETKNVSQSEQTRFFNFRYGMQKPSSDGMVAGQMICDIGSDTVTSSVHRARFLNELVKLMPEGTASFNKRLVGIKDDAEGVLLQFSDGSEARHDAVIGCDGIKSRVRQELLGEGNRTSKPVFSGHYCFRGLAPAEKAIEILGKDLALNSQMYLGNHGHVITTPIEQCKIINVVGYRTKTDRTWNDDNWVVATTKEEMLAKFHDWSEPVKNILNLIEKPDIWALFDHLPAATYHRKGKICLLGDSAHASTPHHGAGAGMAVEDALVLSKLLASINSVQELNNAFAAYDAVRRPRSQKLVASSRKIGEVYNFENSNIKDNMEKMREYLEHAWEWIWNEDLNHQLERAQSLLKKYNERANELNIIL